MLDPLDRYSRDTTLFQFTTKRLRDFIDNVKLDDLLKKLELRGTCRRSRMARTPGIRS